MAGARRRARGWSAGARGHRSGSRGSPGAGASTRPGGSGGTAGRRPRPGRRRRDCGGGRRHARQGHHDGDGHGGAGGRVATWGGNARIGGRELFVVEADEFDRAFLSLAPTVAVVNNVEADHLECYGGSIAALERAFAEFAGRARRVIVGADDAGALRIAAAVRVPVWRVGLAADADVRIAAPALGERGSAAQVALPDGRVVRVALQVPGLHNLRNAAAALAVALELGVDLER